MFYFSCYCDKISNKSNIRKGRLPVAHSLSGGATVAGSRDDVGVRQLATLHLQETNAGAQLTVSSSFSPWVESPTVRVGLPSSMSPTRDSLTDLLGALFPR